MNSRRSAETLPKAKCELTLARKHERAAWGQRETSISMLYRAEQADPPSNETTSCEVPQSFSKAARTPGSVRRSHNSWLWPNPYALPLYTECGRIS